MKMKAFKKIYNFMDPLQQADLVFKFLSEGKEEEANQVFASVPHRLYQCTDQNFFWRLSSLNELALRWSIRYLQLRLSWTSAVLLMNWRSNIKDRAGVFEMLDQSSKAESKCIALVKVLDTLERKFGIDAQSVKRFAQVENQTFSNQEGDVRFQEEMEEEFGKYLQKRNN